MIKRLTSLGLAIVLIGGGGGLALAVSGSPHVGGNAAISQYGPVPTYETPPTYETLPENKGGHGVKGTHEAGGRPVHEGGGPSRGNTKPAAVETPSTGPAAEAGSLPFTGFDVAVLAGIGFLLLLAGLAQRRFESKRRG